MDDIKELKEDVKEIKKALQENTIALVRYNDLLDVHIVATKDLQARIKPIESHVLFIRKIGEIAVGGIKWVVGIAAACATIWRYLK